MSHAGMPFQQFARKMIVGIFALLTLIALFNRIVDPFWYYRDTEIRGFNAAKTRSAIYERHVKPMLLAREKPQAVILGRSYSEEGFDPDNPLFTNNGRLRSMNFALAGAPWGMVQCEFEFAVTHAPIKRILMDIPPHDMSLANCAKDYPNIGHISTLQLLLSSDALQASLDTVSQQNREPSNARNGMLFPPGGGANRKSAFLEFFAQYRAPSKTAINTSCIKSAPAGLNSLDSFPLQTQIDLSGLEQVIDIAHKKGIELVMYIPSSHAYLLEFDLDCTRSSTTWQAMKQIASLVELEAAKGSNVRAYQFLAYNYVTTEFVGNLPLRYWIDPVHFSAEAGNLMLEDMFGEKIPKWARKLSSSTIDSDYHDLLTERADYLSHHPEFLMNLQKLIRPN
jgi:hypothetical protein